MTLFRKCRWFAAKKTPSHPKPWIEEFADFFQKSCKTDSATAQEPIAPQMAQSVLKSIRIMKVQPIAAFATGAALTSLVLLLIPKEGHSQPPADHKQALSPASHQAAGEPVIKSGTTVTKENGRTTITTTMSMAEYQKSLFREEVTQRLNKLKKQLKFTSEQERLVADYIRSEQSRLDAIIAEEKKSGRMQGQTQGETPEQFLERLLTPEQKAEMSLATQNHRNSQAEEFAQTAVRNLTQQLQLTEDQRAKVFQAYAAKKLADFDAPPQPVEPDTRRADECAASVWLLRHGMNLGRGQNESYKLDRATLQGLLTPEQLAVYDQWVNR